MNYFDCIFGNYKFYRKWRKGEWWLVVPRPFPYMRIWVNRMPISIEHFEEHEVY